MLSRLQRRFYVGFYDWIFYFVDLIYHSVCFEECIGRKQFLSLKVFINKNIESFVWSSWTDWTLLSLAFVENL